MEQLDYIAQREREDLEDVEITEPTEKMMQEMCEKHGHMPTSVIADNGFTYECVCNRCGKPLG